MLEKNAAIEFPGCNSLSNSTRLPASSVTNALNPVTLPPGRARRAMIPVPSGSPIAAITIGIDFGGTLCSARGGRPPRDDQIGTKPHQFLCECRKTPGIAIGRAIFQHIILVFNIPQLAQAPL